MDHPDKSQGQIVVVLGGQDDDYCRLNSVLLLNVKDHKKVWREGRAMNEARAFCATVVCNGALYAIGGENNEPGLATIERIDITDLFISSFASNQNNHEWTTLECRLSSPRCVCAAVVVHDRFIVVAGGECGGYLLSSVDIIDTSSQSQCFVISGPPMNVARSAFGMAVVGSRIDVVGGFGQNDERDENDIGSFFTDLKSVEYLEFDDWLKEKQKDTKSVSPSANSWTIHKDLVLGSPRRAHVVVRMGSCLVVVGGTHNKILYSHAGEVLDTQRNIMAATRNEGGKATL